MIYALRFILASDLIPEHHKGIVISIHHALLERDDAIVSDVYVLGAHIGAAPGDVAHARAEFLFNFRDAIRRV